MSRLSLAPDAASLEPEFAPHDRSRFARREGGARHRRFRRHRSGDRGSLRESGREGCDHASSRHREESVARAIIAKLPGKGHAAFPADVADTASLIALRAAIETNFSRLDILVNTSRFTKPVPHGDLDALEDQFIDQMFAVDWRGRFAAIRTFAPLLKSSGDGLIVSVSSVAEARATARTSPMAQQRPASTS